MALTVARPGDGARFAGLDANDAPDAAGKATVLHSGAVKLLRQIEQAGNPDARITIRGAVIGKLLAHYADSYVGFQNGDTPRWVQCFWEQPQIANGWTSFQLTSDYTKHFDGRHSILKWEGGRGELSISEQVYIKGKEAWGKSGVIVRQMRHLPAGLYLGDLYDQSNSVIIPREATYLPAIAAFLFSDLFNEAVRQVDQKVNVTSATFVKVPFDLAYWQKVADEKYPSGLPEPYSDDPTQWLFHGHPAKAETGTALHVALARLCGYRWPAETDTQMRLSTEARVWIAKAASLPAADNDGLLCLPAAAGERPLAERLRAYLAAAFGTTWSDALERRLVAEADERFDKKAAKDGSLEAWLRHRAFRQHCKLFHDRPFLWQVWDGLKDGFSAFIHYHRLDQATLRKLTFTLLNDWLARAKAERNNLRVEKARELQQSLEAILEGEKPYDIFVRWKPLALQPLGWDPDLDDGVRMNIRPFMTAGILRDEPNIKWNKDRGTDVQSAPWYPVFNGERRNDHHTSLAEKRATRAAEGKSGEAAA